MPKTKRWEHWDGTVLEWNGYEYIYGIPGQLVSPLSVFTPSFQGIILARFGIITLEEAAGVKKWEVAKNAG
jgi:hypothetical protein